MKRYIKIAMACILILIAAVSVIQGVRNALSYPMGSFDFQYDSAKLFSLRINPYDESLNPSGAADELGLTEFYGDVEANQFPSLLILLVPFTLLQPYAANIVWAILNVILTVVFLVLMKRLFFAELDNWTWLCLSCIMLAGLGWRNNIGNGQHTIFAFAFFLIALWLSEKKHPIWSGLALALSLFKYTLIIPLAVYLIYKKKYKEIGVAAVFHIVLTVVGAWWIGDSLINVIIKPLQISSALSSSGYIDFGSVLNLPSAVSMVLALAICVGILVLALLRTDKEDHALTLYTIISYVSLIIIYHRTYDFFILIVPVGILYMLYKSDKRWGIPLGASALIFLYSNYAEKLSQHFHR
ncbi:MAG: DUF2029 domain-containing protein [Bacteroides thetaiotaomicron]|nr:DUF2029 domain-containing protein [Bacteroides thetaiotaomicron]